MTRKADYVRSQGQNRLHACHWTGCAEQVPPAMWGCKKHWFRLPKRIRDRIWAAYQPGQEKFLDGVAGAAKPTREYMEAAREAEAWIALNGEQPGFDFGGGA